MENAHAGENKSRTQERKAMSRRKTKWKENKKIQNKFVGEMGVFQKLLSEENVSIGETAKDVEKLSERVIEVVKPYSDEFPDRVDRIFQMGILAWNCAVFPDGEYDLLEKFKSSTGFSEEDFEIAKNFFDDIKRRKELLFPNDRRFIVDFEVIENGPRVTLNVASTTLNEE